jgi:hypothetical protein
VSACPSCQTVRLLPAGLVAPPISVTFSNDPTGPLLVTF